MTASTAAKALGALGGRARAKNLTPAQRSDASRTAALARWARLSPEARSAHARQVWARAKRRKGNAQ